MSKLAGFSRQMNSLKYGFIGTGNMNSAVMSAIVNAGLVARENIFATNRTERKLQKICDQLQVQPLKNNEDLVAKADVIFVGVKPQDLADTLDPISKMFDEENIVVSLAAGVDLSSLRKQVPQVRKWARIMPNTPTRIGKGVVGYALSEEASHLGGLFEDLLAPLGLVVPVSEGDEFEALTVACSSGTGFVFELMQYWQEWIEGHGLSSDLARQMTVETFAGAAALAKESRNLSLDELQKKVVSKKGVTHAGLESMRELEIERALRYSFEKAVLRDRELGQTSV